MSDQSRPNSSYKSLGSKLRKFRQKSAQTVTEVSGAVEIEENLLTRIEDGLVRPDEEILELLINYFNLQDKDAINLWGLAGYETDSLEFEDDVPDLGQGMDFPKNIIMLLSMEAKTLYTDALDIHYDSNGLLLNFKQSVGQTKPVSVARLGMSYEQAEQVRKTLEKVLLHAKYLKGPKSLPSTTKNKKTSSN
jgi:transcriptional regulator with XRE-family HTH domain